MAARSSVHYAAAAFAFRSEINCQSKHFKDQELQMTNAVGRLIAAAIAMVAGAVACTTSNLDGDVGIAILVVASALFVAEYFRAQKQ